MASVKRYVLLAADEPLPPEELRRIVGIAGETAKAIHLQGRSRFLIVKTDVPGAASLRRELGDSRHAGTAIHCILTSGSIGKLKRRAGQSG